MPQSFDGRALKSPLRLYTWLAVQGSLHKTEGITLRQWDDAMTAGELQEKYKHAAWLKSAEDEAIALHHEQRSRGTVPSYGQALAMANLMEQMHLEVRRVSPHSFFPLLLGVYRNAPVEGARKMSPQPQVEVGRLHLLLQLPEYKLPGFLL